MSMEHSHRFFENRDCKYFPCHKGLGDFNCLFCYCPLYARKNCPGNPEYIEHAGRSVKACTNCAFPHQPQNYDALIQLLTISSDVIRLEMGENADGMKFY